MTPPENQPSLWDQFWDPIAKKLKKLTLWGVRVTTFFVLLLLLASFTLEVLHKTHIFTSLHISEAFVTECLLICIFSLGFFAIEQSNRSVEVLESLKEEMKEKIGALQEKIAHEQGSTEHSLASLQEKIILGQVNTEHSLNSLREHQMAAVEIAGFSGTRQFELYWGHMLESYETLVMWGRFGTEFTKNFKLIQEQGKQCSYYLSIEDNTQDVASTFLLCAEEARPGFFKLYETGFFGNLSWVVGFDLPNQKAEVLLCFAPMGDARFSGTYMTGAKAWRFYQSVLTKLEARSAPDQDSLPIRIYSQKQIEMVVSNKVNFKRDLVDVDKGDILSGVQTICEGMTDQLHESREFLDVTHICSKDTIPLLRSPEFVPWIQANYEAAKTIKVTRIFIVPRALRSDPVLKDLALEMQQHKVDVYICETEELRYEMLEDFSIYDERHVIYIDRTGGGPWVAGYTADPIARRSDSWDRVNKYRTLFDIMKKKARPFNRVA
jgi:hypothetical protein